MCPFLSFFDEILMSLKRDKGLYQYCIYGWSLSSLFFFSVGDAGKAAVRIEVTRMHFIHGSLHCST